MKHFASLVILIYFSLAGYCQTWFYGRAPLYSKLDSVFFNIDEALKNPEKVKIVSLENKSLTEFPSQVFLFTNLEEIDLNGNSLSEIPPGIARLKKLKGIFLNDNLLKRIPDELCELKSLQVLALQDNLLRELPSCLTRLGMLSKLNILDNLFDSVPFNFSSFKGLKEIYLDHSLYLKQSKELDKMCDRSSGQLDVLVTEKHIYDRSHDLTSSVERVPELETRSPKYEPLSSNRYWREKYIFKSLDKATRKKEKVVILDLTGKGLSELSPDIGKLVNLEELYLGTFGLKHSLKTISSQSGEPLTPNSIAVIPGELFTLKNLRLLDLSQNKLQRISPGIADLKNLEILDVRDNELTSFPDEISRLKNLKELYISGNKLSPAEVEKIKKLLPTVAVSQ